MKTTHIVDSISEYLEGTLTKEEHTKVAQHISQCKACEQDVVDYQKLFNAFKEEPLKTPSDALEKNFLQLLEEEKQNTVKVVSLNKRAIPKNYWGNGLLKIAASIALLVTAFTAGGYFKSQETQTQLAQVEQERLQLKKTTMMSLLENQSASKRIQAVSYIEDFKSPDDAVVAALADRMLHDENTNVRLTAVDALSKFSASTLVKTAFVEALGTEKDPSVQIAIIQNLVKLQEKKAVGPMKKLLEQEDTQPFVKEEINNVLSEII